MNEIDYIQVVERDFGKLIGIVSRYLRLRRADAEDVVQCALIKAWCKRGLFEPDKGTMEKWLIACCINEGLMQVRGDKRYRQRLEKAGDMKAMRPSQY